MFSIIALWKPVTIESRRPIVLELIHQWYTILLNPQTEWLTRSDGIRNLLCAHREVDRAEEESNFRVAFSPDQGGEAIQRRDRCF